MKRPVIIGLAGYRGSGKTTAARVLAEKYNACELTFKETMLRGLCVIFGVPSISFEDRGAKEYPQTWLHGRSPRYVMQTFGTDWGRDMIHPDIWVDAVRREVDACDAGLIVISDVRFPNEARMIRELGGTVIELVHTRLWAPWYSRLWDGVCRELRTWGLCHPSDKPLPDDLVDERIEVWSYFEGDTSALRYKVAMYADRVARTRINATRT